ncbi:hypothetical protein [Sphingomonas sp. KR3-1]|uniref:hypothetical protein n=1 Tax=Sphingomonas sp. KR3-1 TaxID=3156611 RepID=UPI0032B3E27E
MSSKIPTTDAKTYNAMIGRTTLRGILMTESRFDMKPQALAITHTNLKREVRSHVDEVVVTPEGVLHGFIRFEMSSRQKRQRMIHVSAKYFVSYLVEGGCAQDTAELFIDRVGRLAAYPYFRALTASLVAQAGAQIPPLPIVSFQPRNVDFAKDSGPALSPPPAD